MAEPHSADMMEKLPQALAIQKRKFLIAINKPDPNNGDDGTENVSQADEQLVKHVVKALVKIIFPRDRPFSKQWNDSEATLCVKDTLKKHAVFQLDKYLDCALLVCNIFSANRIIPDSDKEAITMEYVLTHSRQFGDPTKNVFQVELSTNVAPKLTLHYNQPHLSNKPSRTPKALMQAARLISELKEEYDEIKFQALNNRITSFVLIILRRIMKRCDTNLFHLITTTSIGSLINLVIQAYLTSDDEKTKKNIRDTCVKHMEWHKMQLPGLFFKVVELYGVEAGELWDALSTVNSGKTAYSLITLAKEYYEKYKMLKDPSQSQSWFAFCRMFGMNYHRSLSNSANAGVCAILSNLIERKDVLDGPAYKFICPDNADKVNEWATKIAAEIFNKINK